MLEFLSSWTPGHVLNVDHILFAVVGVAATHLALVPGLRHLLRERRPRAPRVSLPTAPSVAAVAPAARPRA